jgi:mono/diheme cytochrome c family protein
MKSLVLVAGSFFLLGPVVFAGLQAQGAKQDDPRAHLRSDIITIDAAAQFTSLELPAVTFLHDEHTAALETENSDCTTCHQLVDGRMSFLFERTENTSAEQLKAVYHNNCIGCHTERHNQGRSSGPLDGSCRDCHNKEARAVPSRQPFGMDKMLHYRHVDAEQIEYAEAQDNCGRCHHQYDESKDELYYTSGTEATCRYCHLESPKDDTRSLRRAMHGQCVDCHRQQAKQGRVSGPETCAGCHGEKAQEELAQKHAELRERLGGVPRLERGQPDAVLVRASQEEAANPKPTMEPVPFAHKNHEQYADSCRVCHHDSLDGCTECHTVSGAKEGDFVQLAEAMHDPKSEASCEGCHGSNMERPECAGCHGFMKRPRVKEADEACRKCHLAPDEAPKPSSLVQMDAEQRERMAMSRIEERDVAVSTYSLQDVPETVTIDRLEEKYDPVKMPHREIAQALLQGIKDSRLAGYFHAEQGTFCQGCHHNSPASKEPPSCFSCHGKPFRGDNPLKPGLKAAYHRQCMNCHQQMNIQKPKDRECQECHAKKRFARSAD